MKKLVYAFAFILGGCAASEVVSEAAPVPVTATVSPPLMVMHMDVAFKPEERAVIGTATDIWRFQTSGYADIKLVYDLDFDSMTSLQIAAFSNRLVRHEGWQTAGRAEDDRSCPPDDPATLLNEHQCVLGWMTEGGIHNKYGAPVEGSFLMDRLNTQDKLVQVALHEFGHAFGCLHLPSNRDAIMYPTVTPGRSACLKDDDLKEFCRVNSCGTHKMIPCEK